MNIREYLKEIAPNVPKVSCIYKTTRKGREILDCMATIESFKKSLKTFIEEAEKREIFVDCFCYIRMGNDINISIYKNPQDDTDYYYLHNEEDMIYRLFKLDSDEFIALCKYASDSEDSIIRQSSDT